MESIPDRYRYSVIPHVMVDGASAAIEFYSEGFGATELFRVSSPDGLIVHAEITIGGSLVMVGDADGPSKIPVRSAACRSACTSTSTMSTPWSLERSQPAPRYASQFRTCSMAIEWGW